MLFWDGAGVASGCGPSFFGGLAFLFLEVVSDAVQVGAEDSHSDVTVIGGLALVRAAVEAVVLEGVNVAFNRAVGVGGLSPFFVTLAFFVGLAEFAFFGHDDEGDVEFEQFTVFDAAKSAVAAEADEFSRGEGAEEVIGEGDDFGAFGAASHDFVVVNEVVLVGGDEEAPTEFDVGAAFAFGDPFGVLFEEGVELFSGGDFAPFQETVADEEDVFDEEVLPVDEVGVLDQLQGIQGMVPELIEGGLEFFFELVKLVEVVGGGVDDALRFVDSASFAGPGTVAHGAFDPAFPMGAFSPAGELKFAGEAGADFYDFAGGVPGEVEVGGEVDVGFEDVAINFDLIVFIVFF